MFRRLFVDHPKSVDENYFEHFAVAAKFGVTMIWGGLCALVHAVVPGLVRNHRQPDNRAAERNHGRSASCQGAGSCPDANG